MDIAEAKNANKTPWNGIPAITFPTLTLNNTSLGWYQEHDSLMKASFTAKLQHKEMVRCAMNQVRPVSYVVNIIISNNGQLNLEISNDCQHLNCIEFLET